MPGDDLVGCMILLNAWTDTAPHGVTAPMPGENCYFDTSFPSDEMRVTTVGIGGGESDSMLNVLA